MIDESTHYPNRSKEDTNTKSTPPPQQSTMPSANLSEIAIADIPALPEGERKVYKLNDVWSSTFWAFSIHSGAFFGCFFGIRGPTGEWPHAWWALGLLVNAFVQAYFHYRRKVARVERYDNQLEAFNNKGCLLYSVPLDNYETFTVKKGCGKVVLIRTDDYVLQLKQKYGCWACCIGKKASFSVENVHAFCQDHGMINNIDKISGDEEAPPVSDSVMTKETLESV